jgi:hypothetical protein
MSTDVDEMLDILKRYQVAARQIADSDQPLKAKCLALLELNRQARQEALPAFAEAATWGAARHLFEENEGLPQDLVGALRGLRRRGLDACPTCLRHLPDHAELDRWQALTREAIARRPTDDRTDHHQRDRGDR